MNDTTTTTNHVPPVNEMVAAVIASACTDSADCMKKVQSSPQSALEQLSGQALSENMQVRTVQNTADIVHVPLPHYSILPQQLTAEQLEKVSGGIEIIFAAAVGLGIVGTATTIGLASGGTAVAIGAAVIGGAAIATVAGVSAAIATGVLASKGKI